MKNLELGHLLSLISHELRAPVGVMRGYLRLLEQQGAELSDMHRQAVAGATKAGDRSTELLNQLSALARLYRGEARVERTPIPLEPLLRSALAEARVPAEPVVTLHVADVPSLRIPGDESLLKGALGAFVTALARSQIADTRIVVSATEETRGHARGVALDMSPSPPAATDVEERPLDLMRGGLGLALPTAAYIMDAHHGHIAERGAQNKLVGFTLWLPLDPAAQG